MCAYQGVKMLGFWFLPNNHKLTEVSLNSVKHSRCKFSFCDSVIEPLAFNWFYMILKIVHKKTDEWYIEWQRVGQRVAASDNKWRGVVQRVITNDNEWYNGWQRVTTNENEWQRVTISAKFLFFQIREDPTTKHPKENSLNIE